jgi:hypothetical protein
MSKTKEFILSHNAAVPKPQLAGVYQAMDEYAAQVLNEYKEKLNNLLDQQRPEPLQNGDSVWQEGYIECFKDLEKEIKKL